MKYLYEQEALNPVSLEKDIGLNRGDIKELTIYPDGAVEVETDRDLTIIEQGKVKDALIKRNLPRGKKPE